MNFTRLAVMLLGIVVPVLAAPAIRADPAPAHYGKAGLPSLADPRNTVVLIYNHGSGVDQQTDICEMQNLNGNGGVPYVVNDLHGMVVSGKAVFVDGFCSQQLGDYRPRDGTGELKVVKRSRAIESRARAYAAAGVPPKQIFLVGQSAGGWASLLVKVRDPAAVNAVIAFAPAFAGRWRDRPAIWTSLREDQIKTLSQSRLIPALIYSIENDEYELPKHMVFMDRIPGVERVVLSNLKVGNVACDSKTTSHTLYRNICFYKTQGSHLRSFIEKRLAAAG